MQLHLQPVEEATLEQVDVPEGACDPLGIPCYIPYHVGKRNVHYRMFASKTCDPMADWH